MVSKAMVVKAAEGLHMRPAGVIAREAGKFDSDVTIVFGDKRINAKSLVNIKSSNPSYKYAFVFPSAFSNFSLGFSCYHYHSAAPPFLL